MCERERENERWREREMVNEWWEEATLHLLELVIYRREREREKGERER